MDFWRFIGPDHSLGIQFSGTYTPVLMLLSVAVACFAAFSALAVVDRILASRATSLKRSWLVAGAFTMGSGIWAMHFTAMTAFTLPVPLSFALSTTLVSVIPAICGSGIALYVMSRMTIEWWRLQAGGLLMALGIGTMHYTGMEAVRADAIMAYDPLLFVVSIVVAHLLATSALYMKFAPAGRSSRPLSNRLGSAIVMGSAVSGMHYTAMAAVEFYPTVPSVVPRMLLEPEVLGVVIAVVVSLIVGLTIAGTVIDSRLKEATDSLHESESFARILLNSAGDGIYGVDAECRCTFANEAAIRLLGYSANELVGRNIHDLIHHSTRDGSRCTTDHCPMHAVSGDRHVRQPTEDVVWRKDGTMLFVEYTSRPIKKGDGVVGAVVTFRDITDQRKLQNELSHAQKMESIGQLAAGIAHEINTPTQYVSDNAQFLSGAFSDLRPLLEQCVRMGESQPDEAPCIKDLFALTQNIDLAYMLEQIPLALDESVQGLEQISSIVSAMKEFSHPGSKEKAPVDVNSAIESTISVSRNEWKYVADVDTDLDPTLPLVHALGGELNQVFLNMIVNAAHAIAERLGDHSGARGKIQVTTRCDGQHAEIRIADDGNGMPDDVQRRMFDPFFTTKEVGKGTGQGLSIAHSVIVDKHGGTISVMSELGVGTTFTIRLPIAQVDSEPMVA